MSAPLPPHRTELEVRFREVDVYGVVWHGHYLDWMEAARHRFAAHFGFDTMATLERGHRLPMLECHLEYRAPARFGDRVAIEISPLEDPRKVVAFGYRIERVADGRLLATGRTVQVVQASDGTLLLGWPPEMARLFAGMRRYEAGRCSSSGASASGSDTQNREP